MLKNRKERYVRAKFSKIFSISPITLGIYQKLIPQKFVKSKYENNIILFN